MEISGEWSAEELSIILASVDLLNVLLNRLAPSEVLDLEDVLWCETCFSHTTCRVDVEVLSRILLEDCPEASKATFIFWHNWGGLQSLVKKC